LLKLSKLARIIYRTSKITKEEKDKGIRAFQQIPMS